jgi:hypothetical protein
LVCTDEMVRGAVNKHGRGLQGSALDWTLCAANLQLAGADVLHFLDCGDVAWVGDTCAEIIATATNGGVDTQFMRGLIGELKDNTGVMTAANLHGRLMRKNGAGVPFYKERWGRKSCVLRRLDDTSVQSKSEDGSREGKRILVGVAVQEDLDVQTLTTWLSSCGVEIEVSGLWDNFLMLTVPIEVWTQLPTGSKWVYIAAVAGGNKMHANRSGMGRALAFRR